MGYNVNRIHGIVGPIREGNRHHIGARSIRLGSALSIQWQGQQDVALRLLRVVEEALHFWPVGALPKGVYQLQHVTALALRLQPVGVIESAALVTQRLDKKPQPIAVCSGLEIGGQKSDRVGLLL